MPSDSRHTLLRRLQEVVEKTAAALDSMDLNLLGDLMQEHKGIMTALRKQGDCRENDMLKLMQTINKRIKMIGQTIRQQRDEICEQLVMAERKKAAVAVYTNDHRGSQSKPVNRDFYTRQH